MDTIPAYISFAAGVLGLVGLVGGAVFYLKFTATKSNLDGKDETIETLEKSRDTHRSHAQELEGKLVGLEAENKTLREIATQTPEIIQLTKAVGTSIKAQNKVADNVSKLTESLTEFLKHKE